MSISSKCYLDSDFVIASAMMDVQDCSFCGKISVKRLDNGKFVCSKCLKRIKMKTSCTDNIRDCEGCGCLFDPVNDEGQEDLKCPFCGGGRGTVCKTPVKRIRELERLVESLRG